MNTNEKPQLKAEDRLLDVEELAEYIGCSSRHVHNLVNRRLIPVVKVGKLTRYDLTKVKSALAKLTIHERH